MLSYKSHKTISTLFYIRNYNALHKNELTENPKDNMIEERKVTVNTLEQIKTKGDIVDQLTLANTIKQKNTKKVNQRKIKVETIEQMSTNDIIEQIKTSNVKFIKRCHPL